MKDEADDADETFPDVVVAVCEPVGKVKEVAHPHRDLEYFMFQLLQKKIVTIAMLQCRNVTVSEKYRNAGTSAAILVDKRCSGRDSRVVM